jgi:hypothetical protein
MLSEYEIERRDRIARNHDTLVALGLGDTSCFILPPSSSGAESKQTKGGRGECEESLRRGQREAGQR